MGGQLRANLVRVRGRVRARFWVRVRVRVRDRVRVTRVSVRVRFTVRVRVRVTDACPRKQRMKAATLYAAGAPGIALPKRETPQRARKRNASAGQG